jgi:hypothetical protein
MLAWAEPYRDEPNTIQLDVMYAYKMTGHFGAYLSADAAYLRPELPFYLKAPFTAAISVHHRHRANHRLMRHVLTKLDESVASIRTSTGGPAVPLRARTAHRFAPYYARIGRRAVTKLTQTALGRPLLAPRPRGWWAPPAARRAAIEMLGQSPTERRRGMRSLSLYDPAAIDRFFAAAQAGALGGAQLLGRIVTIELALREVDASLD